VIVKQNQTAEIAVMYSLVNQNQLHSSSPSHSEHFNERKDVDPSLCKWIMKSTCCTSLDERANDTGAISRFLSDTSANASGSILYLYERTNTRRCKISFLCNMLWVGENRNIESGRLQLNLASPPIHGSVKCPVKSYQTLTMTVQSATTARLRPRLQIYLS